MSHLNLLSEHKVSVEEKFLIKIKIKVNNVLDDDDNADDDDGRIPEAGGDGCVLINVDAQVAELLIFRCHRLTVQATSLASEDSLELFCAFQLHPGRRALVFVFVFVFFPPERYR